MKSSPNIYKSARLAAQLTVEQAAERLFCSETSVKDYEAGGRMPSIDVVDRMCEAYGTTILAYQHMRLQCGKTQVVPDVQGLSLQAATIRLVNRTLAFASRHRELQLLQIAEDGVISGEEQPLFDMILEELGELVNASTEVRLARGEGVRCRK